MPFFRWTNKTGVFSLKGDQEKNQCPHLWEKNHQSVLMEMRGARWDIRMKWVIEKKYEKKCNDKNQKGKTFKSEKAEERK